MNKGLHVNGATFSLDDADADADDDDDENNGRYILYLTFFIIMSKYTAHQSMMI